MSEDMKQRNDSFVEFKVTTNNDIVIASNEHTPAKKNSSVSVGASPEMEI